MNFQVGQTFGDYSVTALLGAGSIGQVYKVEHSVTKRTELMKVLTAELATEIQIQRFEREMRVLARLSHPNIAALHNAIHSEKQLILLMEFVDGRTLESIFSAGRVPIDEAIGYIRQILLALRYAHQQGVVHRDVTPANITITAAGEVKLTDFGLSKSFGDPLLTNCGEILGSLPYLAPERLKGVTQPDQRSDLYSVGAILYEHLTGHKPFGVNRRLAPVLTDTEDDPLPPSQRDADVAPQWDAIISRALARNPEHRYRSAEEFLDAIAKVDPAPAVEVLPASRRTIGLGIALAIGLSVALFASPSFNPFGTVAPIAVPIDHLHIAPPEFAMTFAPSRPPAPPPPAIHAKLVVHSAPETAAPKPAAPETAAPKPAAPETAGLKTVAPETTAPKTAAVKTVAPETTVVKTAAVKTAALRTSVPETVAPKTAAPKTAAPETAAAPVTIEKKRTFWSKLNVFKKKKDPQ